MIRRLFQWIQRLFRTPTRRTSRYAAPGGDASLDEPPPAIEARPTAITAFVGTAASGPTDTALLVQSTSDYTTTFGPVTDDYPVGRAIESFFLNGGKDALIVRVQPTDDTEAAFEAAVLGDAAAQTGVHALDDRVGLLCIPPPALGLAAETPRTVYQQAAARCADWGAVLLIDPPPAWEAAARSQQWMQIDPAYFALGPHASYAVVYFPRLANGSPPLSGAVAGVIARTDTQRGVWKAPAGRSATIAGSTGLALSPSDALLEALNPIGINGVRVLPNSGVTVWGARTLAAATTSGALKYLPIRRLKMHLEDSLQHGLRWVADAPSAEPLWGQIRTVVSAFMQTLYRQGAFQGATPDDAYFVQCGRGVTMTDHDVAAGRVHLTVGFAPHKPAEFEIVNLTLAAVAP